MPVAPRRPPAAALFALRDALLRDEDHVASLYKLAREHARRYDDVRRHTGPRSNLIEGLARLDPVQPAGLVRNGEHLADAQLIGVAQATRLRNAGAGDAECLGDDAHRIAWLDAVRLEWPTNSPGGGSLRVRDRRLRVRDCRRRVRGRRWRVRYGGRRVRDHRRRRRRGHRLRRGRVTGALSWRPRGGRLRGWLSWPPLPD